MEHTPNDKRRRFLFFYLLHAHTYTWNNRKNFVTWSVQQKLFEFISFSIWTCSSSITISIILKMVNCFFSNLQTKKTHLLDSLQISNYNAKYGQCIGVYYWILRFKWIDLAWLHPKLFFLSCAPWINVHYKTHTTRLQDSTSSDLFIISMAIIKLGLKWFLFIIQLCSLCGIHFFVEIF